jgi:hypothetical protein
LIFKKNLKNTIIATVVQLFDFLNNQQFWFFKNFRIKEPLVPVFWEKSELKNIRNFVKFETLQG